jgi:hypothetical protein
MTTRSLWLFLTGALACGSALAAPPPPADVFGTGALRVQDELTATGDLTIVVGSASQALRYVGRVTAKAQAINPDTGLPDAVDYVFNAGNRGMVYATGKPDPASYFPLSGSACAYTLDIPTEIQPKRSWLRLPGGEVKRIQGQSWMLVRLIADACQGRERAVIVDGDIRGLNL